LIFAKKKVFYLDLLGAESGSDATRDQKRSDDLASLSKIGWR